MTAVLEDFGAIRADFIRYYGIRNPLREEARLMLLLIRKLPAGSAFGAVLERRFGQRIREARDAATGAVPDWRQWVSDVDPTSKAPARIVGEGEFMAGLR